METETPAVLLGYDSPLTGPSAMLNGHAVFGVMDLGYLSLGAKLCLLTVLPNEMGRFVVGAHFHVPAVARHDRVRDRGVWMVATGVSGAGAIGGISSRGGPIHCTSSRGGVIVGSYCPRGCSINSSCVGSVNRRGRSGLCLWGRPRRGRGSGGRRWRRGIVVFFLVAPGERG